MIQSLLRFLFPPKCIICEEIVENDRFAICERCIESLPQNKKACVVCGTPLDTVYGPSLCTTCQKRRRPFRRAYVPFVYKDGIRKAILSMKFRRRPQIAKTLAACILIEMRKQNADRPDIITFVPMHFIRLGTRGYNQAELIAKTLGEMLSVPVMATTRKTKHTPPQSKRRRRERMVALRDAYAPLRGVDLSGKRVLLMDDVITTGSTMEVLSRLLKTIGAKEVQIAAAAATAYI